MILHLYYETLLQDIYLENIILCDYLVGVICPTRCTEGHFASFLSSGFTAMTVVNPPGKEAGKMPLCAAGGADYAYQVITKYNIF